MQLPTYAYIVSNEERWEGDGVIGECAYPDFAMANKHAKKLREEYAVDDWKIDKLGAQWIWTSALVVRIIRITRVVMRYSTHHLE